MTGDVDQIVKELRLWADEYADYQTDATLMAKAADALDAAQAEVEALKAVAIQMAVELEMWNPDSPGLADFHAAIDKATE